MTRREPQPFNANDTGRMGFRREHERMDDRPLLVDVHGFGPTRRSAWRTRTRWRRIRGVPTRGRSATSGGCRRSANLSGADLSEANLSEAHLFETNLSWANLSEANLYGANLFRADLSEANISWANLSEANLFEANLFRADLSEANLSWAKIEFINLPSIKMLASFDLGELSDELSLELMRRDAWAHPKPEAFDEWAKGGPCPYQTEDRFWLFDLANGQNLWKKGKPKMRDSDLIIAICLEKGWKIKGYLE